MCSILGVINKNSFNEGYLSEFTKLNKGLSHRGPDNSGVCKFGNTMLGHNRLSIIGLQSKYSKQPINKNSIQSQLGIE
jgi:asparagine synthetase B (glutamine-hydrolysing)